MHSIFYGDILKITTCDHFDTNPRFLPFYARWKSGVTFVLRCFRDVVSNGLTFSEMIFETNGHIHRYGPGAGTDTP